MSNIAVDKFDREGLKKLVEDYGTSIKVRTGAGKIIDLMPEQGNSAIESESILASHDDHSKVHDKDPHSGHEKIHNTHDKSPIPGTGQILDGSVKVRDGVFIGDLTEKQLAQLQSVTGDLAKGKELIASK